ncbi:peptide methionine sulfoxide reductase, partial [Elizabethkingia anophelis]|nr:peptide methionine sulfoxide reductase [Elizabethkingia anophelis]
MKKIAIGCLTLITGLIFLISWKQNKTSTEKAMIVDPQAPSAEIYF